MIHSPWTLVVRGYHADGPEFDEGEDVTAQRFSGEESIAAAESLCQRFVDTNFGRLDFPEDVFMWARHDVSGTVYEVTVTVESQPVFFADAKEVTL